MPDSDMELSSGESDDVHRPPSAPSPHRDELQRGLDFISFADSDAEQDDNNNNTTSKSNGQSNVATDLSVYRTDRQPLNQSKSSAHEGHKRKRSLDDDDTLQQTSAGPPPDCPWMGHRVYSAMRSVPMMLTQELKDFVEYISPTREEHQIRRYVVRRISECINELWSDAEVVVFGSFHTKLYLPSSDLDIVLLRLRKFDKNDLYRLQSHLRKARIGYEFSVITSAKVPLVKFKEMISGIAVDISFNINNGIESGNIINQFVKEIPALRPLTMLIKHFLMIKNHNEVYMGGLGSYTTVIMILSFLQMHPQVQVQKIKPEDNLGVLLIEFFELYGLCFNYSRVGIAVTDGGSYFEKRATPAQGRTYFGRGGGGGAPELLLSCIDPNDPANDTARGSYALRKIREVFVGAYGTLTDAVQRRHRELFGGGGRDSTTGGSKRETTTHVRFDEHNRVAADSSTKSSGLHHSVEVSLIRDVLAVPWKLIEHREKIKKVFYDGAYQDMFNHPKGLTGLDELEAKEQTLTMPKRVAVEAAEITYIHADDSEDDSEDGVFHNDASGSEGGSDAEEQYFANLMREGAREYGQREDKDNGSSAGHRNPNNINAAAESIQLPQLASTPGRRR
ncbi:hypothetical protein BGZ99_004440 [Dissophora globulifera]|uniref:polynucleotide adenylyltransferase n=1 Tax=Dissophora globulifera TaxID=979702 RepID=A0A9P6RKE3_9FUNG|nr:hypothetical protein BGZ99_004440 [Dissophora globulifera]